MRYDDKLQPVDSLHFSGPVVDIDFHDGTMVAHRTDTQAWLWTFAGDGKLASAPIVVNGTAYVHSLSGRVFGVDITNGHMTWSADAGGPAWEDD